MDSRKRRIVSDNEDKPAELYKEWDETLCPICMEHPHNAILIVCSSHEKGCRSYICDTSYRHSNCLDRFKNLKEKNPNNTSSSPDLNPGSFPVSVDSFPVTVTFPVTVDTFPVSVDTFPVSVNTFPVSVDTFPVSVDTFPVSVSNLKCPLCRGTVSGLRVIEEARKYLNSKLRSCSRESCVFAGNYRELREHARRVHPTVRPADVDPSRERAWRRLEDQREYNDTVSAVPGSVVVGDYAIERSGNGATRGEFDSSFGDDFMTRILLYHMMHSMNNLEPVERYQRPRLRGYARSRPPVYVESVMDHDSGSGGRRRRYLWGENLLGLQNHEDDDDDNDDDDDDDDDDIDEEEDDEEEDEEEDDEVDMNMLSDIGPPRRRLRRRITQTRSENEDRQ